MSVIADLLNVEWRTDGDVQMKGKNTCPFSTSVRCTQVSSFLICLININNRTE